MGLSQFSCIKSCTLDDTVFNRSDKVLDKYANIRLIDSDSEFYPIDRGVYNLSKKHLLGSSSDNLLGLDYRQIKLKTKIEDY